MKIRLFWGKKKMGDAAPPIPPNPDPVQPAVPAMPDKVEIPAATAAGPTVFSATNISEETWAQWVRSDKFLLLMLWAFLMTILYHLVHDPPSDIILKMIDFTMNMATGAFSGLMVALRGKQTQK